MTSAARRVRGLAMVGVLLISAGEYLFQCDIHPGDKEGPLIVR
jgi:hypothetical protein